MTDHGYKYFLMKFIRPHVPTLTFLLVLQFVCMLFSFASPLLVKSLIDDVFIGGKTELFNIILLATAATYVISAVSAYLSSYSKGKLELVLFNDVVKEAFDAVQSASMRKTEEMKVGDLISRIVVNTRSAIAIFTQIIPLVFFNAACMIIPFIIMLLYSWQLTLIVTIPALLFVLPMSFFGKRLEQTQKVSLMRTGLIYSLLKECLSIVPLIKVFRLEEWSRCKLDEQMKGYYDASIDYTKNSSLNSSVDSMIYGVPMILLFVFGGPMLMQGSLTIGTFTLFLSNIALVFGPISQFAYLWSYYKSSSPSFERVEEILHLERDIGGYEGLIIKNGKVDFNNISFSYNDRYILQGFNATFNRGLNYVIGENGTGKSTILKLLCALYPLEKGSIEIDGQDIAMVKNADLRKNISMIFSEPYLFDGSIYENILIGNLLASEEEVKSAAKLVRIHEFITNLPQGYKTQVGESGLKLSSGEKQKIALARAILKDSPIILLDEVTKSIDADSRRSINEVIKSLKNEKTIIIVTHDTNEIEYDSNKIYLGQKNNLNDAAFSYASCQISNEASFAGQKRTTEKAIATRISTLLLGHLPRIEL